MAAFLLILFLMFFLGCFFLFWDFVRCINNPVVIKKINERRLKLRVISKKKREPTIKLPLLGISPGLYVLASSIDDEKYFITVVDMDEKEKEIKVSEKEYKKASVNSSYTFLEYEEVAYYENGYRIPYIFSLFVDSHCRDIIGKNRVEYGTKMTMLE